VLALRRRAGTRLKLLMNADMACTPPRPKESIDQRSAMNKRRSPLHTHTTQRHEPAALGSERGRPLLRGGTT
jgi:hypothetical protein